MRDRLNLSLPPELIERINDIAVRKRVTCSAVVEAAVESFLSPEHANMQEAALMRRLDRLSRQIARLERNQRITTETLALLVRFWLTPSRRPSNLRSRPLLRPRAARGFTASSRRLGSGCSQGSGSRMSFLEMRRLLMQAL